MKSFHRRYVLHPSQPVGCCGVDVRRINIINADLALILRLALNHTRLNEHGFRHEEDELDSLGRVHVVQREAFFVGLTPQRLGHIRLQKVGRIFPTPDHRHKVDPPKTRYLAAWQLNQFRRSCPLACRGDLQLLLFSHHAPLANPEESIKVENVGCDFTLVDEQAASWGVARAVGDAFACAFRHDELVLFG